MTTPPSEHEAHDASGSVPAGPGRSTPVARAQIVASGYTARHPSLLRVLEWLGWNNPGASMNP